MIVALLSWYDEPVEWLERMILSLQRVPVDLLIALDGSYKLYGGPPLSPGDQWDAIRDVTNKVDLPTEIRYGGWRGNEVEKRNRLFELGEESGADWYFVIDADEEVLQAPENVHEQLRATPFDVGAIVLDEPGHPMGTIRYPTFPMFFRAISGLRCERAHYRYRTPDGRLLWGDAKRDRLEPRHMLQDFYVEHRMNLRHPDRRRAAQVYYEKRDAAGFEELPTERWITA